MTFHVPRNQPRLLDEQFIQVFPGLGLTTTSNSGAYWGDGDLRPQTIRHDRTQFALETKVRFSDRYKNCYPTSEEFDKALSQLRVRNANAIRLFLVHNQPRQEYGVAIPEADAEQLETLGYPLPHTTRTLRRKGQVLVYRYLTGPEWEQFYDSYIDLTSYE